jgi:hypothetical protein
MNVRRLLLVGLSMLLLGADCQGEVIVHVGHSPFDSQFTFPSISAPVTNDAATAAEFTLVDGSPDSNGASLAVLHDGRVPSEEDEPSANFFFRAGTDGGRVQIDLGRVISVKQVGTYSWHATTRAPQVYKLYAAEGTEDKFERGPRRDTDPTTRGWRFIAQVDTRPKKDGGQHGVAVADSSGALGKFRYLLFDIEKTEDRDAFGNTFFSEIDVLDAEGPAPVPVASVKPTPIVKSFATDGGNFKFTIDVTAAPDLAEWSETQLQPVVLEWYPKIVAMLPSDEYEAPANVRLLFRNDMGGTPASAGGSTINLNARWFRGERDREARGAVVHEMVHVVQNYRTGRTQPRASRPPGWLVEGIADYIRWFLYEPQTGGAEVTQRNLTRAKYDSSYRITGNFLNWVTRNHDREIVRKLNAAAREGKYDEKLWKDWTGKTVQELGDEWREFHEQRLKAAQPNTDANSRRSHHGSARRLGGSVLADMEELAA